MWEAQLVCKDIDENPNRHKCDSAAKKQWPSDESAYCLDESLRAGDFFAFALIEIEDGRDILVDLVTDGIGGWALAGLRRC